MKRQGAPFWVVWVREMGGGGGVGVGRGEGEGTRLCRGVGGEWSIKGRES